LYLTGSEFLTKCKQAQWDALEAAGALNSSQWPSWADWDALDSKVKKGSVKCKNGLAVVEKGNPLQTFRCDNVSLGPLYGLETQS
jgi:hypothetical protein